MGRTRSSSSDSSRDREKRKKSKKKSRKRSRSRDRRSRSRSRDRRSRSRDRRSRSRSSKNRRRSRSYSRRGRSRDRRTKSRTPGGRRKSRIRSKSPSSEKEKEKEWKFASQGPQPKEGVMLTIADELKRARAIADIEGESFMQSDFRTDHMANLTGAKKEEGIGFDFGTSAEGGKKGQDADAGLAHPKLFGDQTKREKKFLSNVFALRQAALAARS